MSELKQQLDQLIRRETTIIICYNGGSRYGKERAVIPISISDEYLLAREVGQKQAKRYILAKIASFRPTEGDGMVNAKAIEATILINPEYDTFEECASYFELIAAQGGWYTIKRKDYFGVCEFFKNGKPKSTPFVCIQHLDRSTTTTTIDLSTGELVEERHERTGRERPWRVDSKRMGDGRSYALLSRAAELFIKELQAANKARQSSAT